MTVPEQIGAYLEGQEEPKRTEMRNLHEHLLQLLPGSRLWFVDGTDDNGKVVSNPSVGYGQYTIHYKNGSKKYFYQVGMSRNTSGISVYLMGLEDKQFLPKTYGKRIGKASVTGYCIKFKRLEDIDQTVLDEAIRHVVAHTRQD